MLIALLVCRSPHHIQALLQPSHELQNAVAVEFSTLQSHPFTSSHVVCLVIVQSAAIQAVLHHLRFRFSIRAASPSAIDVLVGPIWLSLWIPLDNFRNLCTIAWHAALSSRRRDTPISRPCGRRNVLWWKQTESQPPSFECLCCCTYLFSSIEYHLTDPCALSCVLSVTTNKRYFPLVKHRKPYALNMPPRVQRTFAPHFLRFHQASRCFLCRCFKYSLYHLTLQGPKTFRLNSSRRNRVFLGWRLECLMCAKE